MESRPSPGLEHLRRRSSADTETHGRLLNWAAAYRGGRPGLQYVPVQEDGSITPDELDAAIIEAALVAMKIERPRVYRLVWMAYMAGWSVDTICRVRRFSVETYYRKLREAYAAVRNTLRRGRSID